MKKKVLSMLVLLIAVATGAWAGNNGYLYLDLSGTTATLKCSNSPGENPFYNSGNWIENQYPGDFNEFISNCTEITVDASCQNYDGNHYIQLFYDWKALKTINNIGNLKTSSITSMYMMFSGCSSLTTLDLSDWDTSSVGDMGAMFLNCENLTTIYVGSNWSIAAVNSSDNMFLGCEKLPGYNANYDNNATYAHTGAGGYLSVKAATPTSYTVSMKEGTEDATNWTITPNPATAGTQVTATYNGTKKVKSVKAVKKAVAPSFTEVTTFSELQTALSAGKNVKLMNDIDCTAEISITSNGALTIDGNGKELSTTSAIRAFNVGSSATVAFKDLTLTGFVSGGGPAILNTGTIVLDGCTISNCHVNNNQGGGAIENKSNGKLYAINTTFIGNYSGEIGGAINNYNSSLYMSGCTFINNYTTKSSAYWGGAIGINGGSEVRLINCSFSGNKYGTNTGTNDIGVYSKPTNYTIAGCTGAAIASKNGDITTNTTGTATLDYSDLSNISFTYNAE